MCSLPGIEQTRASNSWWPMEGTLRPLGPSLNYPGEDMAGRGKDGFAPSLRASAGRATTELHL